MRYRIYSHLGVEGLSGVAGRDTALVDRAQRARSSTKRPDMTWKDHLVMMLYIGAEIEHSLMVQYLYAAYSLGGEQVPHNRREMVQRWQNNILAVAKEEMGHLLTVQNILTLIGAPINLDRKDLPWDVPFYPFPFRLEPLTLDSVACYVYAEMPSELAVGAAVDAGPSNRLLKRYRQFEKVDRKRIVRHASRRAPASRPHRVGELYDEIVALIADSERIPDSVFQERTFVLQASKDDWSRGHRPDPRLLDAGGSLMPSDQRLSGVRQAHVLVDRMATRTQAVAALKALGAQGEAAVFATKDSDELSHFDRFLEIYQEFDAVKDEGWRPARPVTANPATLNDPSTPHRQGYIGAKNSREWANLFNLRYRMLLKYLAHTFRLARVTRADTPNVRAMVMHRVFGEMYNLKTIAGILVRQPLHDAAGGHAASADAVCAGPPFEMPYTLNLPATESDVWILHRDLLASAQHLCKAMLAGPDEDGHAYLKVLFDIDSQARAWIDQIMLGRGATERPFE